MNLLDFMRAEGFVYDAPNDLIEKNILHYMLFMILF